MRSKWTEINNFPRGYLPMNTAFKKALVAVLLLSLSACFHVELAGPVPGATVVITELQTGALAQDDLTSLDEAGFIELLSQEVWDDSEDIVRLVLLGNFFTDKDNFVATRLYLVTVTGGADMDANSDLAEDDQYTPVMGTWHAIMLGSQLRKGGYVVSPITEALYQSVKMELPQLGKAAILARLGANTRTILTDVNDDGVVKYNDALKWTVFAHADRYRFNFDVVTDLALAITQGASDSEIETLASIVMGEEQENPLQYFTDNISMPIIQSKCINCHVNGGLAPSSGARIVYVTNSNPNHIAINHQALVNFAGLSSFQSQDFSNYVTAKASAQISHGGGRQLAPGSTNLKNLATYLNLIE